MIQIERGLPPTDKHNIEAAKELGLAYDETLGDWVPKKKPRRRRFASGNASNSRGRWDDPMSPSDKVHAHK